MTKKTDKILEKYPPYNFYAEHMILAAIINNSKNIYLIAQKLSIEAFYFYEHKEIYRACLELYSKGFVIDSTTITSWLNDKGILEEIDGINIIGDLLQQIVNEKSLENYLSLVQEKYLRRLLINLGQNIMEASFLNDISLEQIFSDVESKLSSLTGLAKEESLLPMAELLTETIFELKQKSLNPLMTGLSSTYTELDNILQGFQNSDLIILAGRPSIGKTSFSLNVASNIAKTYDLPVLIFSLEMSKQQLLYRFLSTESGVESNLLRTGRLSPEDWKQINQSILILSKLKIFFDDSPNLTLTNIRFKIKKLLAQEKSLGLVIIDYLQLIQETKKTQNRAQELSQITRNLKAIAREFNIPIIVLSQLSRNVEARTNKRPILSDLRESGCLYPLSFSTLSNKIFDSQQNLLKKPLSADLNLISWNFVNKEFCFQQINDIKFTGIKPVYKIETFLGFTIFLTSDHKVFSKNKWLSVDKLKVNSKITIRIKTNQLNEITKSIFSLDKIINIKYLGIKSVFDISVPQTLNFVTNQILVHNSIEQDADVVIMIYREDSGIQLINKSQTNIIEFIVAKHRNGPTGNFRLLYNAKTTRFSNL